ncbi:hypothetical protein C8R47DRAFT_1215443 [Mycena vitilis]|nr:hypothetical protein C8R47DRAFT_1215443 [Mycena vitilis]
MARFVDLPPELILHVVSFVTGPRRGIPHLPDLRSVNALSQTNTILHQTLDQTLYDLCASVGLLSKLAILYAVRNQHDSTIDRLVAAGVSLDLNFPFENDVCTLLYITAGMGLRDMVAKLLGIFSEGMSSRAYKRQGPKATPLDIAARNGHIDTVALLAPIHPPVISQRQSSDNAALGGPVSNEAETHQQYLSLALIQAATAENVEICEYLISEGADVNPFGKPH